jgi:alpha-tubulin suppressor-like RCC1 family protein
MAIKKDGTLWSWGLNDYGQLGDGTGGKTRDGSLQRAIPKKVLDNVAYVSAGSRSAMAIKKDGSLWAWGVPYWVTFNNDTPNFIPTPVKIMDNVAAVSAGDDYSMILKKDGSLWGLGWDSYGRMGDGKYDDNDERILSMPFLFYHDKPIKIMDNVASVSAKGTNTMAVKKDGSLWVWGNNYELQLGYDDRGPEGTTEYFTKSRYRNTPYKVMDGVVAASAGMEFSVALKADGSLLTWGSNRLGQLGYEYVTDGDYFNCNPTIALTDVKLPNAPVSDVVAKSTASTVYVNGEAKGFEAYNIDDSNYFKLRDLAYVLNGTGKQFSVSYDNKTMGITLTSGNPYVSIGGEMTQGNGQAKEATPTASKIFLNGNGLNLKVYTIGGNNFFKLRDLMKSLDVYVGYDSATNAITLDTSKGYVEP